MYRLSGSALYFLVKPLIKWHLKNTRRSYALITHNRDVLLVRNWLGNGGWALPGGGAHTGESYSDAVAREVYEEIGIKLHASKYTPVTQGEWASNGLRFSYQCSHVMVADDIKLSKQLLEITDAEFINMREAMKLPNIAPEIVSAIAQLETS